MNSAFESIKLRMLQAYEAEGRIDIGEWAAQYPDLRDAIVDYWLLLRGTPRISQVDQTALPQINDHIAEDAFSRAKEAIALGPQWLEASVADPNELDQLGASLERTRSRPFSQSGKASGAFRRAAVFGWTVSILGAEGSRVSRLRAQKATYFLERGLDIGLFNEHRQMPFGPYDRTARYKDAEPIARRQGWVTPLGTTHFTVGPEAASAAGYATRYLRSAPLARNLLDILAGRSDDELETWATVDWAARELQVQGNDVTPTTIRALLANTPVWKAKLERPNFTDAELRSALQHLVRLRLVTIG